MAALLDKDSGGIAAGAYNAEWLPKAPGWVVVEHKFDATNPLNTSCVVFFKNPSSFLRVADWWVMSEQLDSGAGLVLNIGLLNSTSNPTALTTNWATSSTLGRNATASIERNPDGKCALPRNVSVLDIGVHFGTVAATPVQSYKKMVMGVLFVPW